MVLHGVLTAVKDYKEKTECLASGQFEDVDEVFNDLDFEAESGEELEDNFVELAGGVDESELEADQQPSEEKQERGTEESDFEEDDVPPLVELRRNEAGGRDYGMLDEQFDHVTPHTNAVLYLPCVYCSTSTPIQFYCCSTLSFHRPTYEL